MATAVHVSLAEYLAADYEPDCEYLEGIVEERNVGKGKHSETQTRLTLLLGSKVKGYGLQIRVEQRVQLSKTIVRIPDICLIPLDNKDEVVQSPPALWIEILSPEDRWGRVQAKIDDCLQFGVQNIWIVDPYSGQAWTVTQTRAAMEIQDGKLRLAHPALEIDLNEVLPEA